LQQERRFNIECVYDGKKLAQKRGELRSFWTRKEKRRSFPVRNFLLEGE
jgi:hypothetical protein